MKTHKEKNDQDREKEVAIITALAEEEERVEGGQFQLQELFKALLHLW
jgi:hypothetical protein